jgi:hypothetical protein
VRATVPTGALPRASCTISSQVSQPARRGPMPPAQFTTVPVALTKTFVSPPLRVRNRVASKWSVVLPPCASRS